MWGDDAQPTEAIRFGAYVCLSVLPGQRHAAAGPAVAALADRLGLTNEFSPAGDHPQEAIAFLRAIEVRPADIDDASVLAADAVVHVASAKAGPVTEFCSELARLLGPSTVPRVLSGVVRPMTYTGTAMYNFAYAHRALQQNATAMPNAFLMPMSKTADWWSKDWLERHTYFLPRYDEAECKLADGHALAAAAGISRIMRRFYKNAREPAPAGDYDFITYFECADEDIPVFHQVCAALRDVRRNPEWKFVREGPTWRGRRVATWAELFDQ